jgi:hypothetical protein
MAFNVTLFLDHNLKREAALGVCAATVWAQYRRPSVSCGTTWGVTELSILSAKVTPKSWVWVPGLAAPPHPNFATYSSPRLLSSPLILGIANRGHSGDIIFLALSDKET